VSVVDSNALVVVGDDHDQGMSTLITEVGSRNGYTVFSVGTGDALKQLLSEQQPSLIALNVQTADVQGLEALRYLANLHCAAEVMLVSSMDPNSVATAHQFGLSLGLKMRESMQKPLLTQNLEKMLRRHKGQQAPVTADEFRQALVEYELRVCYQPILQRTNQGMSIYAIEALVRWQHPSHGLLYPAQFLPMVERENLMTELTDFVLTESLRQVGHWHAHGLRVSLAVNLAARTVSDLDFPDRLSRVMQEHSVAPEFLCFEVTEAAALGDLQVVMASFARLRVKGVQLALDDFGVGTSSLTQLYRIPYSVIKIDRALIAEMSRSKQAHTVVSALIDLAHKLSLQVCAEGIESETVLNQLEKLGCDQFQGNFLSRPLSAVDVEKFIQQWIASHHANAGLSAG
jgi:EAL domain-containing protein (putative c-di-GMP-specific phosphodiesterase class I)